MNLTLLLFLLPSVCTMHGLAVSDAAGLVLSIKLIIGLEFVFFDTSNCGMKAINEFSVPNLAQMNAEVSNVFRCMNFMKTAKTFGFLGIWNILFH